MYNTFKLDNGLRVVVEDIDYVNSVSVGLWVKNGSRNEKLSENGISHFIEHMFFKGTKRRSAFDIAQCIEEVGGQINAFTGKEATCFYAKVLDSHLKLALDVISDMIFNSKFEVSDIEKEKSVVIEEISMSDDSPEDVLSDLHSKAIWGDDPLSFPILGTRNNVQSFTRNQILEYIKYHYIPKNSVISISGKVDVKEIKKLVEEYFGSWKRYDKDVLDYTKPNFLKNNLFKRKEIEQIHLNLGIRGIESGNKNLYTALILSNMIGGGASSILFQKIREERSLCYSIYSYISSFNNTGVISIYTGMNPRYVYDVVNIIVEEIDQFIKNGIENKRLEKLKDQLKGNYILGMESTTSRMFNNGKSILFLNKINTPEDIMKNIDEIDEENIRKVMGKTFGGGIMNSAFVGGNMDIDIIEDLLEKYEVPFNGGESINI